MTYIKTVWDDRLVENPNSYTVTDNGDGTSSIIEAPGTVFVSGTPINATNLNKLEQGVEDVTNFVEKMNTNALNLLDNSNFNAGYYGKYPLSNASAVLETYSSTSCLIVKKLSSSTSTLTINIPAQVAEDYKPNEDFVFSIRYISSATVTIANTANVVVVDGPIILPPSPNVKTSEVKLKFSQATNTKTIVLTLTGLANDDLLIDWLCLTPGTNGGLWVPSKNELFSYINELGANTTTDLNNFKFTGRFLLPSTLISISNVPSGFELGKTSYLDVVGGDLLNGEGKLIQKLQQHGDSKIWYRSVDGSNFSSWNVSNLPIATQSQAQAGASVLTLMTPLRTLESIVYNGNKFFNSTETNLNNLKKSGNYYFANTVNPSNSPYPNGTAFYVEVLNRNQEDFSVQISHRTNTTEIYSRSLRFDNTWTAWAPLSFNIATQSQAQAGTDNTTIMTPLRVNESLRFKNLTNYNDFNNIVENGKYTIPGETISLNYPSDFNRFGTGHLQVINNTGNTLPYQILYQPSNGLSWSRSRQGATSSSSWTNWKRIDNEIATQSQAQAGTDNVNLMTPLRTKQAIDNSPITRYGTATGTNALTITANPLFDNLYAGLTIKFKNTTTNTGNVTANVNTKGVKSVLNNDGTQIQPGKMKGNAMYEITYDGVNFYLTKGGGDSSPIKRIQRGTAIIDQESYSVVQGLQPVNVNKSVVKISYGNVRNISGTSQQNYVLATLENSASIIFSRKALSVTDIEIFWEVIEYEDWVNVQRGLSAINNTREITQSINVVDLNKSELFFSFDANNVGEYAQSVRGQILNNNSIKFKRPNENGVSSVAWFVVDMK